MHIVNFLSGVPQSSVPTISHDDLSSSSDMSEGPHGTSHKNGYIKIKSHSNSHPDNEKSYFGSLTLSKIMKIGFVFLVNGVALKHAISFSHARDRRRCYEIIGTTLLFDVSILAFCSYAKGS